MMRKMFWMLSDVLYRGWIGVERVERLFSGAFFLLTSCCMNCMRLFY